MWGAALGTQQGELSSRLLGAQGTTAGSPGHPWTSGVTSLAPGHVCERTAYGDCAGVADFVDCSERDSLPHCGFIKEITNLSDAPIAVSAYFAGQADWHTVVPSVGAQQSFKVPQGALWLPRNALIRTVDAATQRELQVLGVLGDGMHVVQR